MWDRGQNGRVISPVRPPLPPPRDHRAIASDYDLVVTTYQTLGSDYTRDGKVEDFAPLGKVHWVSDLHCREEGGGLRGDGGRAEGGGE